MRVFWMVDGHQAVGNTGYARRTRILSVLGLFLMCIGLPVLQSGCQEGSSSGQGTAVQTGISGDIPKILVESNVCDLGDVGADMVKSGKFTFKSVGKARLKILEVKRCCGVNTSGVKNGQTYAPGRSGTLEFTCNVRSRLGPAEWELHLKTNDPNQPDVQLTIKAKVVQRVVYQPTHLKFFAERPNAGAEDIKLTSTDGRPFAITRFGSTQGIVTADFDPSKEATEFILKPKVKVDKLSNSRKGQVGIDLTHPECKNIRISFDVLPEFTLSNYQVIFFHIKPGQAREGKISVVSNSGADFDIESVTTKNGIVHLEKTAKDNNRCELTLSYMPPQIEEGQSVFADDLEIKIKGGETLTASVRLFYD